MRARGVRFDKDGRPRLSTKKERPENLAVISPNHFRGDSPDLFADFLDAAQGGNDTDAFGVGGRDGAVPLLDAFEESAIFFLEPVAQGLSDRRLAELTSGFGDFHGHFQ